MSSISLDDELRRKKIKEAVKLQEDNLDMPKKPGKLGTRTVQQISSRQVPIEIFNRARK